MKTKKDKLSVRYKKDEIILAIGKCNGIYKDICTMLDCTRAELTHYINIHSELKPLLKDAREDIVDEAEQVLLQNLRSLDEKISSKTALFILTHLAKNRGYDDGPQVEVNVQSDGDTKILIKELFGINDKSV